MTNKSKDIGELLADDSFIRWIEGSASSEEKTFWQNWKGGGSGRNKMIEEACQLHYQLRFDVKQRDDIEQELFKLNWVLDNGTVGTDRGTHPIHSLNRKRRGSVVWSAAAVLLVCMMISGMVYFLVSGSVQEITSEFADVRTETVETDFGETRQISFSDGTVIMLNANSEVTYSLYSGTGVMEAELDGEAWFEIPPSANRKVSIHTTEGSVHVLGTKFNVSTYGEGTAVVLEQGSVHVEMKNNKGEVGDAVILTPGTMASMEAGNSSIYTRNVESDLYTSWTQNRLRFNETSFVEVEQRIKNIYGLEFVVPDGSDSLSDIRISGSVPNDNIDVLLNALEGLLGRSVSLQGTSIVLERK